MIPLLARLLTFWIPLRGPRLRLRNGFIRLCYGLPVRLKVKKAGPHLHCAGPVHLTKHTELADHVCFNGAWASGNGRLVIGRQGQRQFVGRRRFKRIYSAQNNRR